MLRWWQHEYAGSGLHRSMKKKDRAKTTRENREIEKKKIRTAWGGPHQNEHIVAKSGELDKDLSDEFSVEHEDRTRLPHPVGGQVLQVNSILDQSLNRVQKKREALSRISRGQYVRKDSKKRRRAKVAFRLGRKKWNKPQTEREIAESSPQGTTEFQTSTW